MENIEPNIRPKIEKYVTEKKFSSKNAISFDISITPKTMPIPPIKRVINTLEDTIYFTPSKNPFVDISFIPSIIVGTSLLIDVKMML